MRQEIESIRKSFGTMHRFTGEVIVCPVKNIAPAVVDCTWYEECEEHEAELWSVYVEVGVMYNGQECTEVYVVQDEETKEAAEAKAEEARKIVKSYHHLENKS